MYNDLMPFRFWCQKVLPLAYDDSLSYYEVLCKVVDYMNKVIENNMAIMEAIAELGGDVALETDYVTPEMFGAVGDGLADDTEALQKAIDSGKNVLLSMNKIYNVRNTIHLKSVPSVDRARVSRTIFCRAKTNFNNPNANISCRFANPEFPVFAIDAPNWTFDNVNILARNQATEAQDLTVFKTNLEGVDVDFAVLNCNIMEAKQVFDFTGRGLLMQNCFTYAVSNLIDIKWKTETGTPYHDDYTGQRAIRIVGNRFHSCANRFASTPFVQLTSGTAFGLEFKNNDFDRGYCRFLRCSSKPDGWTISNNLITGLWGISPGDDSLMVFEAGASNMTISGNRIIQVIPNPDNNRVFTNVIYSAPNTELVNVAVTGNMVNLLPDGSMITLPNSDDAQNPLPSARMRGCSVTGNVIGLISGLTRPRAIIRGQILTMERCAVIGNTINQITTETEYLPYAVYSAGSMTLTDTKVMGNAMAGNTDATVGNTGDRTLVRSFVDDSLFTNGNDSDRT